MIALYPDALLAHVLPAYTAGLDVVAAARFLRKNNGKAEPKPDAKWNTSVFVLLQFPDVLYRMDENLEWTDNLGKAVLAQQADVMLDGDPAGAHDGDGQWGVGRDNIQHPSAGIA